MLTDLRDAVRQLRKAPSFTATGLLTLALGIGATTAIFTLVHQVMLKSLPVAKPGELWRIGDKVRCCNWGGYIQGDDGDFALFSWEAYRNFRAQTPEFEDLAALQAGNAPLGVRRTGSRAQADTRNGEYVSGNFFRTFGDVVFDGIPDQFGGARRASLLHHFILVGGHRPGTHLQDAADLLHPLAFGHQLQHFTLSISQAARHR